MDKKRAPRLTRHLSHVNVQIAARYTDKVKSAPLRRAARAALEQQGMTGRVELTIVITGSAPLRALNRQFRDMDAPTDVLSFAAYDSPKPAARDHPVAETAGRSSSRSPIIYLGDVIISYPTAKAQAQAGSHPIEAELQLLVVHGVLHLLGHDHDTRKEKAAMWQAQREILQNIGAAITEPKD